MSVLFVGLGTMGTPMATRLARAGHKLILCDLRESYARDLAERLGATHVPLAEAGSAATVILMLPDSRTVEAVLDEILPRLAAGTLVIDMSFSAPAATIRLAARTAERGLDYVDAPVSGGVARAQTGELSIMVGGSPSAVERARPLFAAIGTGVTHVGPSGAGHAMKALNNLLSAVGLVAAAEVLAIGANFGLEPQTMLDVLNASTGGNHATRVKMARFVLSRAFDSGFSLELMVKDLRTALELAADTATPVPVSALTLHEWTAAGRALGSAADHTHIAAYVEGAPESSFTDQPQIRQPTEGPRRRSRSPCRRPAWSPSSAASTRGPRSSRPTASSRESRSSTAAPAAEGSRHCPPGRAARARPGSAVFRRVGPAHPRRL